MPKPTRVEKVIPKQVVPGDEKPPKQIIIPSSVDTLHPDYSDRLKEWIKIRDCMEGETVIKSKKTTYLPQPSGMTGEYADAYTSYLERAHFPLIVPYALSGALGIVITKLPEFNLPSQLEYLHERATKDGRSLQQLFLDVVVEIFQTGRVPLLVDILPNKNEFRFVQYRAEEFINWKVDVHDDEEKLILGVIKETIPDSQDIFSHDTEESYRTFNIDATTGLYNSRVYSDEQEYIELRSTPNFRGRTLKNIPLFMAGSISNSYEVQPIPLIAVANCSIQIYRKEADLANSEFLSCNPTLCIVGATNDNNLPNVVGSSVMIVLPNEQARIFYTQTDTAALSHVKDHINDLYEEAIRHGVAILDARKGVEAAEALRIRQATQSASIYSIYLSAVNAITKGIHLMCEWGRYDKKKATADIPTSLTQGIPDSSLIKEMVEGFGNGVVPLPVIHRYLVYSGLLDSKINFEDYVKMLEANQPPSKKEETGSDVEVTGSKKKTSEVPKSSKE